MPAPRRASRRSSSSRRQSLLERGDLVGATLGRILTDVEGLDLRRVVVEELVLEVAVRRHRGQLRQERAGVLGEEDLARGRDVAAFVLVDDRVGEPLAHRLQRLVLALLVRGEGVEVLVELGELQLGVVVALGGLLGLVVELVDPSLDVVDVGLGLGRGRRDQPDRESDGESGDGGDDAVSASVPRGGPTVLHERALSLRVVRLPGELTGSGTTGPTPAPRHLFRGALRVIHPRWCRPTSSWCDIRWFPGSDPLHPGRCDVSDSARCPRGSC